MHFRSNGRWLYALTGVVIVITASCGGTNAGGESAAPSASETTEPASEDLGMESPATAAPAGTVPGFEYGECGTAATMVEMNAPIQIVMPDSKVYVCVEILEGKPQVVFEISEMTAPLNLFVGYPDLATLESGGGQFWASEQPGMEDESIVIEAGASGFVDAGSYFIEISGGASAEDSSVVLRVSTN
jgi:hypothetical protein